MDAWDLHLDAERIDRREPPARSASNIKTQEEFRNKVRVYSMRILREEAACRDAQYGDTDKSRQAAAEKNESQCRYGAVSSSSSRDKEAKPRLNYSVQTLIMHSQIANPQRDPLRSNPPSCPPREDAAVPLRSSDETSAS